MFAARNMLFAGGFNPRSLSPALWLSDSGSNPAQWNDISGNNRHFTQDTIANQPSIVSAALNGKQVRRFDGSNDQLFYTGSIRMPGDITCVGICYEAASDSVWIASFGTGNIINMSKTGTLLSSITTPIPATSIQGIAIDVPDDAFWAVDRTNSRVYKLTKAGAIISSWVVAYVCNGICYDSADDSIWVSSDADSVIRHYSASSFTLLGTITTGSAVADGLCIDGNGDLLVSQDGAGYAESAILKINKSTGATIQSYPVGSLNNIEHIAVDSTNGKWLIAVDDLYHSAVLEGNRMYTSSPAGVVESAAFSGVAGITVFVVRKCASNPTAGQAEFIINTTASGFARAALFVGLASGKNSLFGRRLDSDGGQQVASSASVSTTNFQIHTGVFDYANSDAYQYVNGTMDGSSTSFQSSGTASNTTPYQINIGSAPSSSRFSGDIAEILVFPTALSTADRQAVENYLNAKWAIY